MSNHGAPEGISVVVAACFTINYVMGAGFLSIPYGFSLAGTVVGTLVLLALSFVQYTTATMLLDSMARARLLARVSRECMSHGEVVAYGAESHRKRQEEKMAAVIRARQVSAPRAYLAALSAAGAAAVATRPARSLTASDAEHGAAPVRRSSNAELAREQLEERAMARWRKSAEGQARAVPASEVPLMVGERKWEISELISVFLGEQMNVVYMVFVALYLYGALWSYASVFGNSFAQNVPMDGLSEDGTYRVYVLIFGTIVIILSILDVKEQVWLQLAMTGVRLVIIGTMVATVLVAMGQGDSESFGGTSRETYTEDGFRPMDFVFGSTGKLTFSGLATLLPILVYAQLFHSGTAVLVEPLAHKDKAHQPFALTYFVTIIVYTISSAIIATYFGADTREQANTMWGPYHGNTLKTAISYLVVLFPALDVISIGPLNSIALASNMMAAIYGDRVAVVEHSQRRTVIMYRLAASIPSIVGALFVRNLATVLDYTGVIGVIQCFVVPPLLWLATEKAVDSVFLTRARTLALAREDTSWDTPDLVGRTPTAGFRRHVNNTRQFEGYTSPQGMELLPDRHQGTAGMLAEASGRPNESSPLLPDEDVADTARKDRSTSAPEASGSGPASPVARAPAMTAMEKLLASDDPADDKADTERLAHLIGQLVDSPRSTYAGCWTNKGYAYFVLGLGALLIAFAVAGLANVFDVPTNDDDAAASR